MTNRERVMAAVGGEPVDRVPLSFWMHHFVAENTVKDFVTPRAPTARRSAGCSQPIRPPARSANRSMRCARSGPPWAPAEGNPPLAEGRRRSGRAVLGGLPAKPVMATLTPDAVAGHARSAIRGLDGRGLLLGPDCSINPDTPETLLHAARRARDELAREA